MGRAQGPRTEVNPPSHIHYTATHVDPLHPICSCGVKQYPGLADFVKHTAKAYNSSQLHLIQRVCDPFLQFYRQRDAGVLAAQFGFTDPAAAPKGLRRHMLQETPIHPTHSEEDIVQLLQQQGIVPLPPGTAQVHPQS